jgi:serine/threonine protein kinase/tetratricopeptide (TPR) repeat protein
MSQARVIANRYDIEATLGSGGMGVVYRARDRETGETVAVKALRPEAVADEPTILERFRRESEALRRLNHPSIVQILDEVEDDERHYIIMEYVAGGSLAEVLARGAMPIAQVLEIALDLADALTRAHRLKIIHRDLKPQNVLLAEDGTPRLTDFGVAQIQEQSRVTQAGMIIGTISYLSPEACDGAPADERTDIWAFGILLYEMLTGRRPFDESTTVATLSAIMTKPVPPLHDFRPDAPVALVDLVERMLHKNPEDRVPSVRLVGAEVESLIRSLDDSLLGGSVALQRAAVMPDSRFDNDSGMPVYELDFAEKADPPAKVTTAVQAVERRRDQPPRLFISYRREDSAAAADKIAAMLGATFGSQNILKDIDRLMLRTVSRLVLAKDTVGTSDALIVVIGKAWLTGLDDPKDSVRQEIEVGLAKPGMIVLPVLVDGAALPTRAQLPPSLAALAEQPPQRINTASFDADVKRIGERLGQKLGVKTGLRFPTPVLVIVGVVLMLIFCLLTLVGAGLNDRAVEVEPVAPGELMVLVAPIDGGDDADALTTTLNQQVRIWLPMTAIRVRDYPEVIADADEAANAAEVNNAALVIWGEQDDEGVLVHLQTGERTALPHNPFDTGALADLSRLTLRLKDPRGDSLLPAVLTVLGTLYAADGDGYETLRHLILAGALEVERAEPVEDGSVGAALYMFYQRYLSDPTAAAAALDAALADQPDAPILLAYRALIDLRLGDLDAARQQTERTAALAPDTWTVPLYLSAIDTLTARDVPATIDLYTRIIEQRPTDWFPLNYRAALHYLSGGYSRAEADFERVLELEPDANFPYAFLGMIALREGRIADSRALFNSIRADAVDPVFARLVENGGGEQNFAIFSTIFNAFVHYLEGDYAAVLDDTEAALTVAAGLTDLHLLQGLAQCGLGNHTAAEAAYSRGIALDDNFVVLHLLRAQARVQQGRRFPLVRDMLQLRGAPPEVQRLAGQMADGTVNCTNLFQPGV